MDLKKLKKKGIILGGVNKLDRTAIINRIKQLN